MPTNPFIGSPFIELRTVDSTNNYAMGLARAGMAQHGTTVFTHEQTKGKGQRNRHWNSEGAQNLAMSVILQPEGLGPDALFGLSMAVALGATDLLNHLLADECTIKWPNDLYWRDRKAGGILIENIWQQGSWKYAVIGVGINVNQVQFEGLEGKAVSLKQITGRNHEPLSLASALCEKLEARYQQLLHDPESIVLNYLEKLYAKGQRVLFKKGETSFEALVKGVTIDGKLLVQHETADAFEVGEVEWLGRRS